MQTTWTRRLVVCLEVALLLVVPRTATAIELQQVGSQFVRVAKSVGVRYATDRLTDACDDGSPPRAEICRAIVESLADLLPLAFDGDLDQASFGKAIVGASERVVWASLAAESEDFVRSTLAGVARRYGREADRCKEATTAVADRLSVCLVEELLALPGEPPRACRDAADAISTFQESCAIPAPKAALPGSNAAGIIDHLLSADGVRSGSDYPANVALTQLAKIARATPRGRLYPVVAAAADAVDQLAAGLDNIDDQSVFDESEIDAVLAVLDGSCRNEEPVKRRLQRWQRERVSVFRDIARSIAYGVPPDPGVLGRIPTDLPDPECPQPDADPLRRVRELRRYATTYATDAEIVANMDRLTMPALLIALHLDMLRRRDAAAFRAGRDDLALRALARGLAVLDADGLQCEPPAGDGRVYRCSRLSDPARSFDVSVPQAVGEDVREDFVNALVKDRYSVRSARHTCVYQAIATAIRHGVSIARGTRGYCREIPQLSRLLDDTVLAGRLSPAAPTTALRAWTSSYVAALAPDRLEIQPDRWPVADLGTSLLATAIEDVQHAIRTPDNARAHDLATLLTVLDHARQGHEEMARQSLLDAATAELAPLVASSLDRRLTPLSSCLGIDEAASLGCSVRLLAEATVEPAVYYLAAEPSSRRYSDLAASAYRKLEQLDPLGRTPVLLNVGLGLTWLASPNQGEIGSPSAHLTLLEKIGVAYRWGRRNQWEAGVFAGGFVEALVRQAADTGEDQAFWLLGATIGIRQLSVGVPFGIETHVAASMPFELSGDFRERIGLGFGLAVVVPAELLFNE